MSTETKDKSIANLLIVSDQLEQIDRIQKILATKMVINSFTAVDTAEIKRIINNENIDLVYVGESTGQLSVGGVASTLREARKEIPIAQLLSKTDNRLPNEFIKNGANLVCLAEDPYDILVSSEVLINSKKNTEKLTTALSEIDSFKAKFMDLYQGLADPICYVQDGVFINCNASFLRTFEITDETELEELTIVNFVERKEQSNFKDHLRKSTKRDLSASPVIFNMKTKLDKALEFVLMSKPSIYEGEECVQLYFRSTKEGGMAGGAALFDETTGFANKEQMNFFLQQTTQKNKENNQKGYLVYVLVENYRDIWGMDGIIEAEKLTKAVAHLVRREMPAKTEISRYTDDGLLLYIPVTAVENIESRLKSLVKKLDTVTPDDMRRMVGPHCFASYSMISRDADYNEAIAKNFRSSRLLANGGDSNRVTESLNVEVSDKDNKRLSQVSSIIKEGGLTLSYQPIASFMPDGSRRYRERITVADEQGELIENQAVFNLCERNDFTWEIDRWKIEKILQDLLGMDENVRKSIQVFILLSRSSLQNKQFIKSILEKIRHTGLKGEHFVFELTRFMVQESYSAAIEFAAVARKIGAAVAVTQVGILNDEARRILNDVKPDIIKLDMREINTLEDNEEEEIMSEIRDVAETVGATIIAEYLESPGQIARIWPYDIKFIQGDGMTPLLEEMNFNFDEFAI